MNTIVCIKQVPSTNEVKLDPVTHTIIRDSRASVINPFDLHALEEAIRIKEVLGGKVTALSMGIPATEKLLRDAVSRGADNALLLSDRKFAGADTLATSYALSLGVKEIGEYDLIICGKMAVDGDTAQIGPELAQTLNITHVTDVMKIDEIDEKSITCTKVTDNGEAVVKVKLPALITVLKDMNMIRMPSITGIRNGINAEFKMMNAEDAKADISRCGLDGSPTQVVKTFTPPSKREAMTIVGDVKEQAQKLCGIIKEVV